MITKSEPGFTYTKTILSIRKTALTLERGKFLVSRQAHRRTYKILNTTRYCDYFVDHLAALTPIQPLLFEHTNPFQSQRFFALAQSIFYVGF